MALVLCKECNHQISDKAPACPNCGAPRSDGKAAPEVAEKPKVQQPQPKPEKAIPKKRKPKARIVMPIIGGIIIIGLVAFYYANRTSHSSFNNDGFDNSYNSGNSEPSYQRKKTPTELKAELRAIEESNPLTYLQEHNVTMKWETEWKRGTIFRAGEYERTGAVTIKGQIYNKATLAGYKDIKVKISWFTRTETLLKEHYDIIYKVVTPGGQRQFEFHLWPPEHCEDFGFKIVSAKKYRPA